MKKVSKILILSVSLISQAVIGSTASAVQRGISMGKGDGVPTDLFSNISGNGGIFSKIINTMLFLVGVLSVMMIVWGGLRYVISRGDSKAVEGAKNTILYALVGLIVAIMAYAIVRFVVGQFIGGGVDGGGTNGIAPTNI